TPIPEGRVTTKGKSGTLPGSGEPNWAAGELGGRRTGRPANWAAGELGGRRHRASPSARGQLPGEDSNPHLTAPKAVVLPLDHPGSTAPTNLTRQRHARLRTLPAHPGHHA